MLRPCWKRVFLLNAYVQLLRKVRKREIFRPKREKFILHWLRSRSNIFPQFVPGIVEKHAKKNNFTEGLKNEEPDEQNVRFSPLTRIILFHEKWKAGKMQDLPCNTTFAYRWMPLRWSHKSRSVVIGVRLWLSQPTLSPLLTYHLLLHTLRVRFGCFPTSPGELTTVYHSNLRWRKELGITST